MHAKVPPGVVRPSKRVTSSLVLAIGVISASLGANVGVITPEQVPAVVQQEASAHGLTHEMDPCYTSSFPVTRYGQFTLSIGVSECGVTNGHAKWHNVEVKLQRYETWETIWGDDRAGWRTKNSHRSPGAEIFTHPERSARVLWVCPRGRHLLRTVTVHNVNGDLGLRSWSVPTSGRLYQC